MNPLARTARALALALICALPVCAQTDEPTRAERIAQLQDSAVRTFVAGDYPASEAALREVLELDPKNFVAFYNLACVRAALGDTADAAALLRSSIESGFIDKRQLLRDPHLAPLRNPAADGHASYREVIDNWSAILDAHRESNLAQAQRVFKDGYAVARDDDLRLVYLSAFDPGSFEKARSEVALLTAFARSDVFPDPSHILDPALDPWIIVILPTQRDFQRWQLAALGPGALHSVGGAYDHDTKRLVAQDLGATLRHEFFHVLHWRSNTHQGLIHPIWVQEGVCSLVEDYDVDAGGTVKPTASWRTNMVKRLDAGRRLPTITQFTSMPRARFTGSRPLANYGYARAIHLYLWQRGALRAFLAELDRTMRNDPTGLLALTTALNVSAEDFDKDFRAWLRELPMVAEEVRPGMASLGIEIDPGTGDGPVVASVVARTGAARSGLALGDVITALDGRPTRDMQELVRVLSEYEVGQTVTVSVRRGRVHRTAEVTLTAR